MREKETTMGIGRRTGGTGGVAIIMEMRVEGMETEGMAMGAMAMETGGAETRRMTMTMKNPCPI